MIISKFGVLRILLLCGFLPLAVRSECLHIELCGYQDDAQVQPGDAALVTLTSGQGLCFRNLYGFPLKSYVFVTSLYAQPKSIQALLRPAAYINKKNFQVNNEGEGYIFTMTSQQFEMGSPFDEPKGYKVEVFSRVVWCNERSQLAPVDVDYGVFVASYRQHETVDAQNCILTLFGQINLVRVTILSKKVIAKDFKLSSKIFQDDAAIGSSVKLYVQNELRLEYVGKKPLQKDFVMKFEAVNKSCTAPPSDIPNAIYPAKEGPWNVGDGVLYTCTFGYQPALVPNIRKCDYNFEEKKVSWSRTATCKSERCLVSDKTAKIENGIATAKLYSPGTVLEYTCNNGYERATIVSCQSDYTWSNMPLCTIPSTSTSTVAERLRTISFTSVSKIEESSSTIPNASISNDEAKAKEQDDAESSFNIILVLSILGGLIVLGGLIALVAVVNRRKNEISTQKRKSNHRSRRTSRREKSPIKENGGETDNEFGNEKASEGSLRRSESAEHTRRRSRDSNQDYPKARSHSHRSRSRNSRRRSSKRI